MRITVIASAKALDALGPLLAEYRKGHLPDIVETAGEIPEEALLLGLAERTDALLLVGSRKRAPRTVLPGPFITGFNGRLVPAGWLPEVEQKALARFAAAAAGVHRRKSEQPAREVAAVLSQWHPRYLKLAARIAQLLEQEGAVSVMRWEADQLLREDMVAGLSCGLGAAFYVGHGRPIGWVGYHGTRTHHFQASAAHPLGVLFSLCCETASRKRTGLSFAESLPLRGLTAACFAAVKPTLHVDNTRWALGLCQGLNKGAENLAELICSALPTSDEALNGYRILGDPLAPLVSRVGAYEQAQEIGRYNESLIA